VLQVGAMLLPFLTIPANVQRMVTKTQVSFSLYTSFQRWSTALLNISPDELRNENSATVRRLGATIQNFTKTDRGTNGYKSQGHRQVSAINRDLGPPSLFLTLSSRISLSSHFWQSIGGESYLRILLRRP